jgi:hypothetical protein
MQQPALLAYDAGQAWMKSVMFLCLCEMYVVHLQEWQNHTLDYRTLYLKICQLQRDPP